MAQDTESSSADRRAEYRERLAGLAEDNPEASGPELARMLSSKLTRRERDELALDYLNTISVFSQQYRYMVSRDRTALRKALITPPRIVDNGAAGRGRPPLSLYDLVIDWKEKVTNGSYRPVLKMTRLELQGVIDARMKQVVTEVFWIEMLRRIVAGLPNDAALVEAHFSDTDIANLASTVQKGMQRGNLRFKFEPLQALPGPLGLSRQTGRRNP